MRRLSLMAHSAMRLLGPAWQLHGLPSMCAWQERLLLPQAITLGSILRLNLNR